MTVMIEKREHGWYVRCGDRYQDCLGSDETLWTIASILMNKDPHFLRTAEEHAKLRAQFEVKTPLEPWEKLLEAPKGT